MHALLAWLAWDLNMQCLSGHIVGFKLAKFERGGSVHATSRQCLEPLPSALQIFDDLLINPDGSRGKSWFNRAEMPRSDAMRLGPEPICLMVQI